MELINRGKFL